MGKDFKYNARSVYNKSQLISATKYDVKAADTNPTVLLPLGLQTLQQRAKLVTPQPSVTLRDTEAMTA